MDLNHAVVLLAAFLALRFFGEPIAVGVAAAIEFLLSHLAEVPVEVEDVRTAFIQWLRELGLVFLPFLVVVFVAALAVNLSQVGFLFTTETMTFNLAKLNPFTGVMRLFSLRGFVRTGMGAAKLAVIAAIAGTTLWGWRYEIAASAFFEMAPLVEFIARRMVDLGLRVSLGLLILGILDYLFQRWQYEQDIKMSKQEVKEELKMLEGDPKIKERRRRVQMQLAVQRMLGRVPKATVVITNPTEVAVALEYEANRMGAPVLTAKGTGRLAQRIRELAVQHRVPIVPNPPLARALYRGVEVGQSIPPDLYRAVAEVIAHVYRMRGMAA